MTQTAERWRVVRPVQIIPRPAGVWWARVPDRQSVPGVRFAAGALCQEQEHPVYLGIKPLHETEPGCQGNEKARTFWICAQCCPPKDEPT